MKLSILKYSLRLCEERAVHICPSTCHVPCFSAQLPLCYSFTNNLRGRECRLWIVGGWLAVVYRGLCPQSQVPDTQWVVSVACLFPPLASRSLLFPPMVFLRVRFWVLFFTSFTPP